MEEILVNEFVNSTIKYKRELICYDVLTYFNLLKLTKKQRKLYESIYHENDINYKKVVLNELKDIDYNNNNRKHKSYDEKTLQDIKNNEHWIIKNNTSENNMFLVKTWYGHIKFHRINNCYQKIEFIKMISLLSNASYYANMFEFVEFKNHTNIFEWYNMSCCNILNQFINEYYSTILNKLTKFDSYVIKYILSFITNDKHVCNCDFLKNCDIEMRVKFGCTCICKNICGCNQDHDKYNIEFNRILSKFDFDY